MKKNIFLFSIALLPIVALSSEPSAFGSSDFSSGTTSTSYSNTVSVTEMKPQNSQKTATINETVVNNKTALSNVSEEYEGMRSVMESYATKIAKQDEKMRQLEEEIAKLREYVEESRKIQTENQDKIKVVVGELGTLIDSINKDYVPKDKFDQLANELRGSRSSTATKAATTPESAKKDAPAASTKISAKELSTKDSATLIKEADDYFDKKSYTEAQTLYTELLSRNYKPAKVNFTLGEIAYTQKSYTKAIEYYKSSISLFDKAAYTPTLLYHTGTSFQKLGKTKDAQGFYKALKENYPDSPEAKKIK